VNGRELAAYLEANGQYKVAPVSGLERQAWLSKIRTARRHVRLPHKVRYHTLPLDHPSDPGCLWIYLDGDTDEEVERSLACATDALDRALRTRRSPDFPPAPDAS
jgi:hypothetical protein